MSFDGVYYCSCLCRCWVKVSLCLVVKLVDSLRNGAARILLLFGGVVMYGAGEDDAVPSVVAVAAGAC